MIVNIVEVLGEVVRNLLEVVEDLPEVLLNQSKNSSQFNVAESGDHIVGHRVVLISKEKRELSFKVGHDSFNFSGANLSSLLKLDLVVDESSFDQEVEADQELYDLVVLLLAVESLGK